MPRHGQYNPENAAHRKIIRLIADCHSNAEVAEMVGVALITVKRVRYSPEGKKALSAILDEIDEQTIKLHSARMVMRSF